MGVDQPLDLGTQICVGAAGLMQISDPIGPGAVFEGLEKNRFHVGSLQFHGLSTSSGQLGARV